MRSWQSGRSAIRVKPITKLASQAVLTRLAPDARIPWWPGATAPQLRGRIYDCSRFTLPKTRKTLNGTLVHTIDGGVHIHLLDGARKIAPSPRTSLALYRCPSSW